MMIVVFCSDPLNGRLPDAAFAVEATTTKDLALPYVLIDYEALVNNGDSVRAVRRVEAQEEETCGIYRGWMLRPEQYSQLFARLLERNIHLINDPDAYRHCHYLPESFEIIARHTPATVWMRTSPDVSMGRIRHLLQPFGDRPVLVKDCVKSRKHEWFEACFIPSASDHTALERVVRRFLDLQDPDLNEGLVFREFVELEPLVAHSQTGMLLAQEHRIFYLDGKPLLVSPYWDQGEYTGHTPPPALFGDIARAVRSRFFSMDVARRRDGEWIIIELGDGQVAGLPECTDVQAFYSALNDHFTAG